MVEVVPVPVDDGILIEGADGMDVVDDGEDFFEVVDTGSQLTQEENQLDVVIGEVSTSTTFAIAPAFTTASAPRGANSLGGVERGGIGRGHIGYCWEANVFTDSVCCSRDH